MILMRCTPPSYPGSLAARGLKTLSERLTWRAGGGGGRHGGGAQSRQEGHHQRRAQQPGESRHRGRGHRPPDPHLRKQVPARCRLNPQNPKIMTLKTPHDNFLTCDNMCAGEAAMTTKPYHIEDRAPKLSVQQDFRGAGHVVGASSRAWRCVAP